MNFYFINIFVNKINIKFNIFYIVDLFKKIIMLEIDISKYQKLKYREQIEKVLEKHKIFFYFNLNHFNNKIEISIFFKNEFDVVKLKQNFFNLSQRDY